MSYSTTLPSRSAAVSGGELIQSFAFIAGAGPWFVRFVMSTGPEIDDGFDLAATSTLASATTAITPPIT